MRTTINPCGLRNRVTCNEQPHHMLGAHFSACCWWGHEQSGCKRPHPVLGSPWARSAIWREWKHSYWEESKTAKEGKCYSPQRDGHETRFRNDNWQRTYLKTFLKTWTWCSCSREWLLYWLRWHQVIEMCSLTVKKPMEKSQYYLLWMWKHGGIWH